MHPPHVFGQGKEPTKDVPPFLADGSPRTTCTWNGVVWDSSAGTNTFPAEKVDAVRDELAGVRADVDAGRCPTKGVIMCLVGTFVSMATIIRGASAFINPLSRALWRGGDPTNADDTTPCRLDDQGRECLREWERIIAERQSHWCVRWLLPAEYTIAVFLTDAAGALSTNMLSCGWAIVVGDRVIKGIFDDATLNDTGGKYEDMTWKEIWPVLFFIERYAHELDGLIVATLVDNMCAGSELNRLSSSSPQRQAFLWRIARAMRRHNFELLADWRCREQLKEVDYHTRA
jgi:hypothetical protein